MLNVLFVSCNTDYTKHFRLFCTNDFFFLKRLFPSINMAVNIKHTSGSWVLILIIITKCLIYLKIK